MELHGDRAVVVGFGCASLTAFRDIVGHVTKNNDMIKDEVNVPEMAAINNSDW